MKRQILAVALLAGFASAIMIPAVQAGHKPSAAAGCECDKGDKPEPQPTPKPDSVLPSI